MDSSGIKDIAEGLKRRIELLLDSGITAVHRTSSKKDAPASGGACPAGWAFFEGALREASSFSPCGHQGWKGVLFGFFPLGRASVVWGVPVSGQALHDNPFGAEPASQLEKMFEWLAVQLKCAAPNMSNPQVVLAASCPEKGAYSDAEAAAACCEALEPLFSGSSGVLLMGELAAWAFLQTADLNEARGKAHRKASGQYIATYSPDELVKDQNLKKAAHADLKLLISSCNS